jgi:hypothetical protein
MHAPRLLLGFLALFVLAAPVRAATLEWNGTLALDFSFVTPIAGTGTGVATVNGSSGLGHLNTLRFPGGLTAGGTVPYTDPDAGYPFLQTIIATATLASGTLAPIGGGGPLTASTLPVVGLMRLLIFVHGAYPSTIPLTVGGTRGVGLGGVVTFNGFDIAPFNFKASIQGAPWTVGVASVTGVQTANGAATTTVTAQGFAHGPMSASTTANPSGVVQLVTPTRVTFTNLGKLTGDHALFTTMRLHFIPEPGQLLLLGCGAAALLVVGRGRMRL